MSHSKITIQYIENIYDEEYIIPGWRVDVGDKYANGLGYDEMLGLIAAITLPKERPGLQWLMTEKQHEANKKTYDNE